MHRMIVEKSKTEKLERSTPANAFLTLWTFSKSLGVLRATCDQPIKYLETFKDKQINIE